MKSRPRGQDGQPGRRGVRAGHVWGARPQGCSGAPTRGAAGRTGAGLTSAGSKVKL